MNMVLEVEKRSPIYPKKFGEIEKALRALRSYGPQSYASLTRPDGSYVQVAGGRVTCALEMYERLQSKHWRAYLEEPRVPFDGQQILSFGGGQLNLEPDEILFIEDVIGVFMAFFELRNTPDFIKWRDISGIINR